MILAHSNCILVLYTIVKKLFVIQLVHEVLRFKVLTTGFMASLCIIWGGGKIPNFSQGELTNHGSTKEKNL